MAHIANKELNGSAILIKNGFLNYQKAVFTRILRNILFFLHEIHILRKGFFQKIQSE